MAHHGSDAGEEREARAAVPAGAPVDILLVDDSISNMVALEAMLEPLGQNLVRAGSGMQALRHLLRQDFALVLLDIQMPGLNGFETAKLIRARERSRHLHIIFLTAFSKDDAQISLAYELGAVDFLFKPLVPFILRSKVQVFIDLYRMMGELKRQATLLRGVERREHERTLADAGQRWEAERMAEEQSHDRQVAAALADTVAEREQLIAELSLRNRELAHADRRKDEFLAMLAHELRNPMAPILNAVQLLRMPAASASSTQRALGALDRQTGHLVRLVDDLLDLSRITTGKIELRREPVRLSSVVQHAVQTSMPLMEQREQSFRASMPEEEILLLADGTRLSQVIANLLNNAAKYSPVGSEITLEAGQEGAEIVILVRDRGIGIRPDMLEEVFGLFVQFERTEERAQGGLGIGLTLVRSLVTMHGGSVTARSEGLGLGSEFCVRLPATRPLTGPPPASTPRPPRVASRVYRVMIIEDNEDIRETMRELFVSWGHEATMASDGPSGVEGVLAARPDIAFIDIGLPELDGYGVAAALRARAPDLATWLVAVTGYGRPEDRARALAAGFDEHLVKPVSSRVLLELIESR